MFKGIGFKQNLKHELSKARLTVLELEQVLRSYESDISVGEVKELREQLATFGEDPLDVLVRYNFKRRTSLGKTPITEVQFKHILGDSGVKAYVSGEWRR